MNAPQPAPDYFRRDQKDGISPPDLSKDCSFAEHIVHARGKRTKYTSVSLDLSKIRDFGDTSYLFNQGLTAAHGHILVLHEVLLAALRQVIQDQDKADRLRAIQALRYATKRKEGLVDWRFDTASIARKDLIAWAARHVQQYFSKT